MIPQLKTRERIEIKRRENDHERESIKIITKIDEEKSKRSHSINHHRARRSVQLESTAKHRTKSLTQQLSTITNP